MLSAILFNNKKIITHISEKNENTSRIVRNPRPKTIHSSPPISKLVAGQRANTRFKFSFGVVGSSRQNSLKAIEQEHNTLLVTTTHKQQATSNNTIIAILGLDK